MSRSIKELEKLVERLRAQDGCPWDRAQTPESVKSYLVEEAMEAAEAIAQQDPEAACEELGDLLFQVVFTCYLFAEQGLFTLDEAAQRAAEKMVRRHPHVFGPSKLETPEEVKESWQRIKAAETAGVEAERNVQADSILDGVPRTLPGLLRAHRLSQRAAQVGFDWPGLEAVLEKVAEELAEFKESLPLKTEGVQDASEKSRTAEELGDLFFSLANLTRHLKLNPEEVIQAANDKFEKRFRRVEARFRERGESMDQVSLKEMDQVWDEIKEEEAG